VWRLRRGDSVAQRDSALTHYTDPQAVMGSPPCLSPEQAQGREVTAQSDLYSLGCVLYALLAEGPPFTSGNVVGFACAHVHEVPERVESRHPEAPGHLAQLVHRIPAKDPGERTSGAHEVAERMRAMARPVAVQRTHTALDRGAWHVV
jgi:serine/threonine protein kinase